MSRYLLMMGFDADSADEAQAMAEYARDLPPWSLTLLGVYAETAVEALTNG